MLISELCACVVSSHRKVRAFSSTHLQIFNRIYWKENVLHSVTSMQVDKIKRMEENWLLWCNCVWKRGRPGTFFSALQSCSVFWANFFYATTSEGIMPWWFLHVKQDQFVFLCVDWFVACEEAQCSLFNALERIKHSFSILRLKLFTLMLRE